MLPYQLTTRAAFDLENIRERYSLIDEDLGRRFALDFVETMCQVRDRPTSFPIIDDTTRIARLRSFTYRIYFEVGTHLITIAAVYHTSRDPAKWNDPDRD